MSVTKQTFFQLPRPEGESPSVDPIRVKPSETPDDAMGIHSDSNTPAPLVSLQKGDTTMRTRSDLPSARSNISAKLLSRAQTMLRTATMVRSEAGASSKQPTHLSGEYSLLCPWLFIILISIII